MISAVKTQMKIVVGDENKKPLALKIIKANIARGRMIALALIIIELCVIAVRLAIGVKKMFETPNLYYFIMYLLMISFMTAVLIILEIASKKENLHLGRMNALTYACAAFVLSWNMVITLLDIYTRSHFTSYFLALVAVGMLLYLRPKALIIIYLSVHTAYLILLASIFSEGNALQAEYINTSVTMVISLFIGFANYRNKALVFVQQRKIEQKNILLNHFNEKLIKTNKELEYLSQTDGLTGIYNRRMFDSLSQQYWDNCKSKSASLTVVMMDIDYFKKYNDNHGHIAGDECLIKLVGSLKHSIGSMETLLARYGGEEFVLMVCGITKKASFNLAEKIRMDVEKLGIERKYKKVANHVTLSLGVYHGMPSEKTNVKEFIEHADKALYAAKSDNRNNTKMAQ